MKRLAPWCCAVEEGSERRIPAFPHSAGPLTGPVVAGDPSTERRRAHRNSLLPIENMLSLTCISCGCYENALMQPSGVCKTRFDRDYMPQAV